MLPLLLLPLWLSAAVAEAVAPTRTYARRAAPNASFVSVESGGFSVNNAPLKFVGTNAYWLSALNSDADINNTLHSIKAAGLTVVRTWAFNDVPTIPVNGTWFQLIKNGTLTINTGENGLQRLDTVIELAEKLGLFVLLSLTNNWNPLADEEHFNTSKALTLRDITVGTNNSLPRNFLSNDYGGIDAYVRGFNGPQQHDQFYTNATLLNAFLNYTNQVVSRYVNSTAVFAYELANDPRCNSSLPASSSCNTTTITEWHSEVSTHIRSIDPNHLISSGTQGFLCIDCPKKFTPANQPQPSLVPLSQATRKRSITLTKEGIFRERAERWKRTGEARRREEAEAGLGPKIRGKWAAPETKKRQNTELGNGLDGSQGVDSQDILNIPDIDFGTFQVFPDQNQYTPEDPSLPAFNNTLDQGVSWINLQGQLSRDTQKPTIITAFGLVTENNAPFFVPFNLTCAPFSNSTTQKLGFAQCPPGSGFTASPSLAKRQNPTQATFGVSTTEQDDAYTEWLDAALLNGIDGALQYQWSQGNLTTSPNTTIEGSSPNSNTEGSSPNDGYAVSPVGTDNVIPILTNATNLFG